jgi:hypothetical protein
VTAHRASTPEAPPNNAMKKLTKRMPFEGRRAFARLRHQVALRS